MTQIKAIVFDLDGVLVNSLTVMRLAFEASIRAEYGNAYDVDQLFISYRKHLGKGFPQIMQALGLPGHLHEPFKRHSRYLANYIYAYTGVAELLKTLNTQGFMIGVATGKDGDRARELLDSLMLAPFVNRLLGSDEVKNPKPEPDMLLQLLDDFAVGPEQAVMVGDAVSDIRAGKSAGMYTAAALWGYTDQATLVAEQPNVQLTSPADILLWLNQQNIMKRA
ncbi:MAG: HAD-IA family hydrolase [Cellvibrionaceae bacterium]|nr:HAD-IA family hydrolase [Cellvibrionaceae bacterium]